MLLLWKKKVEKVDTISYIRVEYEVNAAAIFRAADNFVHVAFPYEAGPSIDSLSVSDTRHTFLRSFCVGFIAVVHEP
jgi:hypothetical protein